MLRTYQSPVPILFAVRFMPLLTHLILLVLMILDRKSNVNSLLKAEGLDQSSFTQYDTTYTIWIGLSIGFVGIELISFLLTLSALVPFQSLISICTHSIAVFILFAFYTDSWRSDYMRFVFGFCTVVPCITEAYAYFYAFLQKKVNY